MFASLVTYWDKLFGFDNFWFSGFCVGLAYLPYGLATGIWLPVLYRALTLAIAWGVWSLTFSDDDVEELGRGGFIVATLPIL